MQKLTEGRSCVYHRRSILKDLELCFQQIFGNYVKYPMDSQLDFRFGAYKNNRPSCNLNVVFKLEPPCLDVIPLLTFISAPCPNCIQCIRRIPKCKQKGLPLVFWLILKGGLYLFSYLSRAPFHYGLSSEQNKAWSSLWTLFNTATSLTSVPWHKAIRPVSITLLPATSLPSQLLLIFHLLGIFSLNKFCLNPYSTLSALTRAHLTSLYFPSMKWTIVIITNLIIITIIIRVTDSC